MLPGPIFTVSTRVSRYRAPPRPHFTSPRACSARAGREVFKNFFSRSGGSHSGFSYLSRAGGGSLEAAFLNIPQLLVPYKHGTTSQHQLLNAQFLEKKGAAKIITSYEELKAMLNSYLDDELSKLEFNIKAGNDHIGKVLIDEIN